MQCPKCQTEALKKSSFNAPHICPGCGGMWRQGGDHCELPETTIEALGNETLGNETLDGDDSTGDMDKKTGLCPAGHGIMIRAQVALDQPFYLEKCTACGGIWFDKGEWLRIAEHNLADSLPAIWSKAWQRRQREEKDRQSYLELNKKLLGEKLFDAVMALASQMKAHPERDRAMALLQQESA
jgi:Zn-finger nucleic acid-binding protein